MMADIDLEEFIADNYPSQGWLPIGNSSTPFKGVFDGNGKKITHLTINRPSTDYVGFFAYTEDATLKSLTIDDAEVKGGNNSAVLAGKLTGGNVSNIAITGNVKGKQYTAILSGYGNSSTTINTINLDGNVKGTDNCGMLLGLGIATISNIKAEGEIIGDNYVGGIVGKGYPVSMSLCSIKVLVKGGSNVGGCVGGDWGPGSISKISAVISINTYGNNTGGIIGSTSNPITISECNVSGDIYTEGSDAGGIIGSVQWHSNNSISNNYFAGKIFGKNNIAGIVGSALNTIIHRNYANAYIVGGSDVGGIIGTISNGGDVKSNISICQIIKGDDSVGRIYGKKGNNNVTIGAIGSTETNKALTTTKLIINGNEQTCEDDLQNGQSTGNSLLKYKASYQGVGWDFSSTWAQQETESYPYFQWQTAPPVINKPLAGATTITGKGTDGALIEVQVGSEEFQTVCNRNTWSVTTLPLSAGSIIYAMATEDGKSFSYRVTERVQYQGNGTEVNPYLIHNAIELANVNGSGYYKVMNDIDASSINPWIPIGQSEAVNANIDGCNFTISGLSVNSDKQFCGLIASTQGVTLKNINLQINSFSGGKYSGGLVGVISEGTIHNCHIIGDVQGGDYSGGLVGEARNTPIDSCSVIGNTTGSAYTGGLAGCANANITDCAVEGNVSGTTPVGGLVGEAKTGEITKSKYNGEVTSTANNAIVGGLVGNSYANISECYSVGTAQCAATGSKVGGLVGVNNDAKTITNCYSTSTVTAEQNGGGLVGYNYGAVSKCYAQGNVTSTKIAGGIVGYNDGTNATVQNSFAMNQQINATSSTGIAIRVIGGIKNSAPTPEMNNYALKTMAVSVNGVPQTIYDDNLNGVSKTDAELKQAATYSSASWDMSGIWKIDENQTYPYLLFQNAKLPQTETYTVTWKNYDGSVLETDNDVPYGTMPQYNGATPTKPADEDNTYTFSGWTPAVVTVAGNASYTATFQSVSFVAYTITWQDEDGNVIKTDEVKQGTTPAFTGTTPTKPATNEYTYEFAGWLPKIQPATKDICYTTFFERNKIETPVYTVNINGENCSLNINNQYPEGTVITLEAVADECFEFQQWSDGNKDNPRTITITANTNLTAEFNKVRYTVTGQPSTGGKVQIRKQ